MIVASSWPHERYQFPAVLPHVILPVICWMARSESTANALAHCLRTDANEERIPHAKRILDNLAKSITDTCYGSAFDNPTHFSSTFRYEFRHILYLQGMSTHRTSRAKHKRQEPWPPEFPEQPGIALTDLPEPLADHLDYNGFVLSQHTLDDRAAEGTSFREIRFRECSMSRTAFGSVEFSDVRFDSCALAGANWEKARIGRVAIYDCGMVGMRLLSATIDDLLVHGSNCDMALFWKTRFHRARFERCSLRGASFEGADLSGVAFSECDLTGADLRATTLIGTDFRGSRIEGIAIGAPDLRGAIISPDQAADLVGLLGVTVRYDGE